MTIKKSKRIISKFCVLLLLISHLSPLLSIGYAVESTNPIFSAFSEVFADSKSMDWVVEDLGASGEKSVQLVLNAKRGQESEKRITFYATDTISIETKQSAGSKKDLRTVADPENPGATRQENILTVDTSSWDLSTGIESITYNQTTKVFEVNLLSTSEIESIIFPARVTEGQHYGLIALEAKRDQWNKAVYEYQAPTETTEEPAPLLDEAEEIPSKEIPVQGSIALKIPKNLFTEMANPINIYFEELAVKQAEEAAAVQREAEALLAEQEAAARFAEELIRAKEGEKAENTETTEPVVTEMPATEPELEESSTASIPEESNSIADEPLLKQLLDPLISDPLAAEQPVDGAVEETPSTIAPMESKADSEGAIAEEIQTTEEPLSSQTKTTEPVPELDPSLNTPLAESFRSILLPAGEGMMAPMALTSPTDPRYTLADGMGTYYSIKATDITSNGITWEVIVKAWSSGGSGGDVGDDMRISYTSGSGLALLSGYMPFYANIANRPALAWTIDDSSTSGTTYNRVYGYSSYGPFYNRNGVISEFKAAFTTAFSGGINAREYTMTVEAWMGDTINAAAAGGTRWNVSNATGSITIKPLSNSINAVNTNSPTISGTVSGELSPNTTENIVTISINGTYYTTQINADKTYTYVVPVGVTLTEGSTITTVASNGLVRHTASTKVQKSTDYIQIVSKDQMGNPISEASYTVKDGYGNSIGTYTTGPDGTVNTVMLIPGQSYTVTQDSLPGGYAATANSPQTVTSLPAGGTALTFTNTINTNTTLTVNLKKAGTETNLSGATFEIWMVVGMTKARVAGPENTDANGNVTFTILNGREYEIHQTAASGAYTTAPIQKLDLRTFTSNRLETVQFYNSDVALKVLLTEFDAATTKLTGGIFELIKGTTLIESSDPTGIDGTVTFTKALPNTDYQIVQTAYPTGYGPYTEQWSGNLGTGTLTIPFQNTPLRIRVNLTESNGGAIAGAEFVIKDSAGNVAIGPKETDASGQVIFEKGNLEYGKTYTIVQNTTLPGYITAHPTPISFIADTQWDVAVQNGELAKIQLTLKDGSGAPVVGAEFVVKENGAVVGTPQKTDTNGMITFMGLEQNKTYVIEQISGPTGMPLLPPQEVTLSEMTTILGPTLPDSGTGLGTMTISAIDKVTRQKLPGAEFKVTALSGAGLGKVYYAIANANGIATLTYLPIGDYQIEQTKAPDGYMAFTGTESGPVAAAGVTLVELENGYVGVTLDPAIIKIRVRDMETGNPPIEGVTVEAKESGTGKVYYGTTDANGIVYFSGLDETKTYTLRIVSAPYEYGPNPEVPANPISFSTSGQAYYVEADLLLQKIATMEVVINVFEYGDADIPIRNADVEITMPDGTKKVVNTGNTGSVSAFLPAGSTYTIQQKTTDGTHLINTQIYTVSLDRPMAVFIPNRLVDPSSSTRTIAVTKAWDGMTTWPTDVNSVSIDLMADGAKVGATQTITSNTLGWKTTFYNVPKYDAQHKMINYTIREGDITGYYPVYMQTDQTGNNWKVTNYKGVNTEPVTTCSPPLPEPNSSGYYKISSGYISSVGVGDFVISDPSTYEVLMVGLCSDAKTTWNHSSSQLYKMKFFTEAEVLAQQYRVGVYGTTPITTAQLESLRKIMAYAHEVFLDPVKYDSLPVQQVGVADRADYMRAINFAVWDALGFGFNKSWGTDSWIQQQIYNSAKAYDPENPSGYGIEAGQVQPGEYKLYFLSAYNADGTLNQKSTQASVFVQKCTTTQSEINEIDVHGQKTWVGDAPEDRPVSIIVQLIQRIGSGAWTDVAGKTATVTADANGNWTYSFTGLPTKSGTETITYSVRETVVPPGYTTQVTGYNIENRMEKVPFSIIKYDETGKSLAGAEFTLYASNEAGNGADLTKPLQGPKGSDSLGYISFDPLPVGTYYLKETKAPTGYIVDPDTYYKVVVGGTAPFLTIKVTKPDGTVVQHLSNGAYPIYNEKLNSGFELVKTDQMGNVLAGATFRLTDVQGIMDPIEKTVDPITGKMSYNNLPEGSYQLEEITPPPGYYPNDNLYDVVIDAQGKVTISLDGQIVGHTPLIVVNYKKGELVVQKVDENGDPIPGSDTQRAQFTLKGDPPLNYEQTVTVDIDGYAKFENLASGTYTLKETRTPPGYVGESKTYLVTVATDGKVTIRLKDQDLSLQPLIIENRKEDTQFTLKKVNEEGVASPILTDGVRFTLYQEDQTTPVPMLYEADGVTIKANYTDVAADADGLFYFQYLDRTKIYYLKETATISGYMLDPNYYEIKFKADGTLDVPTNGRILFMESNGQWSFKNFPVGEYPATGGWGILPYFLIGLSLMAMGLYNIRKKCNKGGVRSVS
ncbi:MAG: SpaA isopeptide-forming pilin-related protein [Tissierellia bacterium]|nr:SpaA isopeptide-forming pilin-related protein [Tissierellia bacterium]